MACRQWHRSTVLYFKMYLGIDERLRYKGSLYRASFFINSSQEFIVRIGAPGY